MAELYTPEVMLGWAYGATALMYIIGALGITVYGVYFIVKGE